MRASIRYYVITTTVDTLYSLFFILVFSGVWRVEALFGNALLNWFRALDLVRSMEPNGTTQVGSASRHVKRATGGLVERKR